jgi:DNA invertase Pin-like site-specific DNA recombinase
MDKTCIIYTLASEGEVERLKVVAADYGHIAFAVLTDSPATAPGQGAGWQALVRMVSRGSVGMIIVPTLVVLGSGLDDLVKLVAMMAEKNVDMIALAEGIDSTRDGTWMASVAGLQQYQVGLRHQKARAGHLRAMEAGVRFGRPPIPDATIAKIRVLLSSGQGIRRTSRITSVSPARISLEKKAMAGAENLS